MDDRISLWANRGNHLDGIFLDDLSYIFTGLENHRRSLWAYSDWPLSFSYASRKVVQYGGNAIIEFCKRLRSDLAAKGLRLMGSNNSEDLIWVAPWLDIVGGEVNNYDPPEASYLTAGSLLREELDQPVRAQIPRGSSRRGERAGLLPAGAPVRVLPGVQPGVLVEQRRPTRETVPSSRSTCR